MPAHPFQNGHHDVVRCVPTRCGIVEQGRIVLVLRAAAITLVARGAGILVQQCPVLNARQVVTRRDRFPFLQCALLRIGLRLACGRPVDVIRRRAEGACRDTATARYRTSARIRRFLLSSRPNRRNRLEVACNSYQIVIGQLAEAIFHRFCHRTRCLRFPDDVSIPQIRHQLGRGPTTNAANRIGRNIRRMPTCQIGTA